MRGRDGVVSLEAGMEWFHCQSNAKVFQISVSQSKWFDQYRTRNMIKSERNIAFTGWFNLILTHIGTSKFFSPGIHVDYGNIDVGDQWVVPVYKFSQRKFMPQLDHWKNTRFPIKPDCLNIISLFYTLFYHTYQHWVDKEYFWFLRNGRHFLGNPAL